MLFDTLGVTRLAGCLFGMKKKKKIGRDIVDTVLHT
jgi:hypothetical protein